MTGRSQSTLRCMLRLLLVPGLGPSRAGSLLRALGSPEAVLAADRESLGKVPGVSPELAGRIAGRGWDEAKVDRQLERIESGAVRLLYRWDTDYPPYLAQIYDPPPLLFLRGQPDCLSRPAIAIVGTRGPSHYGLRMARDLAAGLAGIGFTVVSGLARGIDSEAHRSALDAGGATVAVLGCGLDIDYPPENAGMAGEIAVRGAVVSEYLMGTPPEPFNFPRRNRIISGLSRGVLVVEAGQKSGALITAAFAADQNREVFAVPGDASRGLSAGANSLIKQGAKLVQSVEDVLEELGELFRHPGTAHPAADRGSELAFALSREERFVFESLSRDPQHVDELASRTGLDVPGLLGVLLRLELKLLVREHPGKLYSLC